MMQPSTVAPPSWAFHLFFVFVSASLVLLAGVSAVMAAPCPSECVCRWKGGKETVECVSRGLMAVPAGMDESTHVLDLTGNNLPRIPEDTFLSAKLLNLQKIYMAKCRIENIDEAAFSRLSNLIELDLSENRLTSVPTATFKDFPGLRRFHLSNNPITTIENNAFAALTSLKHLEISRCRIETVASRGFQGLHNLTFLKLDGNLLTVLTSRTLAPLKSIQGVDLHENPWRCDCAMQDVKQWLKEYKITPSVPLTCASPPRLEGRTLKQLDFDELACPPRGFGEGFASTPENPDYTSSSVNPDTASLSGGGHGVLTSNSPPVQPQSPPPIISTAYLGYNASLVCRVTANPQPRIQWFRHGHNISNQTRFSQGLQMYVIHERGSTEKTSVLTITSVGLDDAGAYSCLANNRAGSWTSNFSLRISTRDLEASGFSGSQIAGLSIGLLVLGAVVLLLICVLLTKWRRRASHHEIKHRPPVCNTTSSNSSSNASSGSTLARRGLSPHAKLMNSVNHIDLRLGKLRGITGSSGCVSGPESGTSSRASVASSLPHLSRSSSVERTFSDEASDSDKTLIDSSASPCRLSDKPDVVNVGRHRNRWSKDLQQQQQQHGHSHPDGKPKKDRRYLEKRAAKERKLRSKEEHHHHHHQSTEDNNDTSSITGKLVPDTSPRDLGRCNSQYVIQRESSSKRDLVEEEEKQHHHTVVQSSRNEDFRSPPPSPEDWSVHIGSYGGGVVTPNQTRLKVSSNGSSLDSFELVEAPWSRDGRDTLLAHIANSKDGSSVTSVPVTRLRNYVPVLPPLPAQHFARVRNSLIESSVGPDMDNDV